MEKFLTHKMYKAYIEMYLGIMVLRISDIQEILIAKFPSAAIASSYENQSLILEVKKIISEIRSQGLQQPENLREAFTEINRIFLISTWEFLKETSTYSTIALEPTIQFFRHVRNGCAHNNTFNFDQVKNPARWRDKTITDTLKGTPVIPDFIKDADPLILLVEINNKYFEPINIEGFHPYQT
ncbi:MAG: hypothetical protein WBD99_16100 [Thermodesulfobacteriota bacterium]